MFAGWVNRQQLSVIAYLQEENRILKDRLGDKRLCFTPAERGRLARKAHRLGRKVLAELQTLVTPDTLLRWYRELIAAKWDTSDRRGIGRPRTQQVIADIVVRMATENPGWGYTRIMGALTNLGHHVSRGTIATLLKEHGIEPAPERGTRTRWSTFLKAHWQSLVATDFLSVEVCTMRGLVSHYVLFFIDLPTRTVHIAGITPNPDEVWMSQMARNLTDSEDGLLRGKTHVILDRDTKYTAKFRHALTRERIEVVPLPPRSPNLNAFAERFVRSVKEECLHRMIFLNVAQMRHVLTQYLAHYHQERNHQGLENRLLCPMVAKPPTQIGVVRRQRLGGLLNFYRSA